MSRKPATVVKIGYRNPHKKHTMEPTAITGILPIVSVSFPLKGLETPAVRVKSAMINPLYSAPPNELR